MLGCETVTEAEPALEPSIAHAPQESTPDETAEESSVIAGPLDEDDHHDLAAAAQLQWVDPAFTRRSRGSSVVPLIAAALLGIGFHGLLIAACIFLGIAFRHREGAYAHFERGGGIPIGDASLEENHDAGGAQRIPLPPVQNHSSELPPVPPPPLTPPEETPLDPSVKEFATAEISRPDESAVPVPIIGVGAMPGASALPRWRPKHAVTTRPAQVAQTRPVLLASTQPSNPKDPADPSPGNGNAIAASAGLAARPHVRTHPGAGGTGGAGGSTNGLDGRGLPIPDYPTESRRRREQGMVVLEVEVRADGKVGGVRVVEDGGFPRLADAAVDAIRRGHFMPATDDGQPVPEKVLVPYQFVLR